MLLARSAGDNDVVVFMSKGRPTSTESLVKLHAGIGALRHGGNVLLLQREQRALGIERDEQVHLTGLVLPGSQRDGLQRRSSGF